MVGFWLCDWLVASWDSNPIGASIPCPEPSHAFGLGCLLARSFLPLAVKCASGEAFFFFLFFFFFSDFRLFFDGIGGYCEDFGKLPNSYLFLGFSHTVHPLFDIEQVTLSVLLVLCETLPPSTPRYTKRKQVSLGLASGGGLSGYASRPHFSRFPT